jgi:ATP-dependent Clp protease adapter protein ClpS
MFCLCSIRALVAFEGDMDGLHHDSEPTRLVIHDDDETPQHFVRHLLQAVFGQAERDAIALTSRIERDGKVACGPYPEPVAKALFDEAQQRVRAAGHDLLITSEAAIGSKRRSFCDLCAASMPQAEFLLGNGKTACLCTACLLAVRSASEELPAEEFTYACDLLDWHFEGIRSNQLVTTARRFPGHMRADIQTAVEKLFSSAIHFSGIHDEYRYETLNFSRLMKRGRNAEAIAPAEYHDVDTGEVTPVKCLQNGLWLCRNGDIRYAVVLSLQREPNQASCIRIEIAVPMGQSGAEFVQRCFAELEAAVQAARSYRGKILSFEGGRDYRGRSRGVMVHRLPAVDRHDVVLPERTLKLLDRNVLSFVRSRDMLRGCGQSTRKGILLYGPPGTGKTHTIRYLATNLPGHTTLIITAEQVVLLDDYMNLARLLQPTMVVIEDVDLIARAREEMGACEEPLLNKLLNQMDGLTEDADILFVLTTNRPEQLEGAVAGRPGRIDQAIEIPLPDETGRGKLIQLYGRGLELEQTVVDEAVRRTKGVSAAFIKELMRRAAQASFARGGGTSVLSADIDEALNEILFAGGELNVKLLGGGRLGMA